jgi:cysteine desulfuration protein SufE
MQALDKITDFHELHCLFAANKGWDTQYRLIIQLGKLLTPLPEVLKIEDNQVRGCESLAWLVISEENGVYHLQMDSDTRVVKGLMKIVCLIFHGKTLAEIEQIDGESLFAELGLLNHLSPSRTNGLFTIINSIKGVTSID